MRLSRLEIFKSLYGRASSIICQYDISHTIITDNDQQFIGQGLVKFYEGFAICLITSSVEHPQINSQAEANKVILNEVKKWLGTTEGRWTEELVEVLLAYLCTPQS